METRKKPTIRDQDIVVNVPPIAVWIAAGGSGLLVGFGVGGMVVTLVVGV